jgi:fluoride exporter
MNLLWIFIGGGLGSILRYSLSLFFPFNPAAGFPWATFFSNLAACVILGVLLLIINARETDNFLRPFFIIGLCGGFSTFSAFSLETVQMIRHNHWPLALLNIGVSLGACLAVLFILSKKA